MRAAAVSPVSESTAPRAVTHTVLRLRSFGRLQVNSTFRRRHGGSPPQGVSREIGPVAAARQPQQTAAIAPERSA